MVCHACKDNGERDYIKHKDSFSAAVKRGDYGKFATRPFCLMHSQGDQREWVKKLKTRARRETVDDGSEAEEEPRERAEPPSPSTPARRRGERGSGRERDAPSHAWRDPTSDDWFDARARGGAGQSGLDPAASVPPARHGPNVGSDPPLDAEDHHRQTDKCFRCGRHGHWSQDCTAPRLDLPGCTYADRERAKAELGAKWDPPKRIWWTYRAREEVQRRFPQWLH